MLSLTTAICWTLPRLTRLSSYGENDGGGVGGGICNDINHVDLNGDNVYGSDWVDFNGGNEYK